MRISPAFFLLALALLFFPFCPANALVEYKAGEGWSTTDANGDDPTEATASAQFQKAQSYESSGDFHRAMLAYRALVRKFPRSGVAADSQFKAGEMAASAGDYDLAYSLYNAYLAKYPKGSDFDKAVEAEFNIGQKFLEGARRRLFGVKTFPSMQRAQQIFEAIVKNAPYSKWAPQAQFYVGQSLEKQGKPQEAIAAYQTLLSQYPSDPAAADAQYQIGYVHFTQSKIAYDKAEATKAEEAFQDFLARYPNSEKAAQAQDDIKALQGRSTANSLGIAKFYDKVKDYKAAVIYYNEVIQQEPGTPDAQAAQARIAAIKSKVGDEALASGPEKTENGKRAQESRRLQAQVDTASRADYLGPPVVQPTPVPDQVAPGRPPLRSSPRDLAPVPAVEPPLPAQ